MKIKYNSEIISGGVFLIAAAVLWLLIPEQIQTMETTSINAQTIPRISIGGMFLFSLGLLLQGVFSVEKKEIHITGELFRSPSFLLEMKSVLYAAILLVYLVVLTFFGFLVATVALVIVIMAFYGSRKWYYYAIPVGTVFIVYFVFATLLHVSLP